MTAQTRKTRNYHIWTRCSTYRVALSHSHESDKYKVLFQSAILDCTTAVKWVWVATCYEQIHEGQKYYVCEFINVQPGKYRLGYYSSYRGCIVGLSKSFVVADTPS